MKIKLLWTGAILATLALTLGAISAFGEEPKKPSVVVTKPVWKGDHSEVERTINGVKDPPTLDMALSAEFWSALAKNQAAQVNAKQAQTEFEAVQVKMAAKCGPDHTWDVQVAWQPKCNPKPILTWSGHDNEYVAKRGPQIVAMIVKGADGFALYDQRESSTPERPAKIALLTDSLDKAKAGAAGW